MLIPILDAGHGGMIGGVYQVLRGGKQSPNYEPFGVLYEGAFNRWLNAELMRELDYRRLAYYNISPELKDTPLHVRSRRANEIYQANPNVYVLSNHANAGGGEGIEGFTSKGDTDADPIAEKFLAKIEQDFPERRMRFDNAYDGDRDKEADYHILIKTLCPSILLEWGFMDFRKDYDWLLDRNNQRRAAVCMADVVEDLQKG